MDRWLADWWMALVAAAVVGHFGLHLAIYNRLNATGLPRRWIKRIEVVLLATCLAIPPAALWSYGDFWSELLRSPLSIGAIPTPLALYAIACLATVVLLGIPWLLNRPLLERTTVALDRTVERVDVAGAVAAPLALTRKCRWASRLPANQIFHLAIEQKQLPVPGLPPALDGLRIAHLSDLHLTGQMARQYSRYVADRAAAWQPDLIALTGDLIDAEGCIDWLENCLGGLDAPEGAYSVLGNHDTRVRDPGRVRQAMCRLGWHDLGTAPEEAIVRGVPIELLGNERPWFPSADPPRRSPRGGGVRIVLSHSPDQIGWAREQGAALMLAGHTHGGQGRLPLVGPLLSPSRYGSRFASGTFYLAPTTMHVSRGLGGTHLLRLNCPPELALLVLRGA